MDPRIDTYIAKSADFAKPILIHLRGQFGRIRSLKNLPSDKFFSTFIKQANVTI